MYKLQVSIKKNIKRIVHLYRLNEAQDTYLCHSSFYFF